MSVWFRSTGVFNPIALAITSRKLSRTRMELGVPYDTNDAMNTFGKAAVNRRKPRPYRKRCSRKLSLGNETTFANSSQPRRVVGVRGRFAPSGARSVGFLSIGSSSAPSGPRCGFFSAVLAFVSIRKPPGYSRGLAYVQCMSGIWIVWDGRLLAIWCVFRVYVSVVTN